MTVKEIGIGIGVAGAMFGGSYLHEWSAYSFESRAMAGLGSVQGARFLNKLSSIDIASPATWIWPTTDVVDFAFPDPMMSGRFYVLSMLRGASPEEAVFLIDVDCDEPEKATWYDLKQPATAYPARDLWGEPVHTKSGEVYRQLKKSPPLPAKWQQEFCHTDWQTERQAVGEAAFAHSKPSK